MTNNITPSYIPAQIKMTNYTVQPLKSIVPSSKPCALYNGVTFVVWAFGIYILTCAIKKLFDCIFTLRKSAH